MLCTIVPWADAIYIFERTGKVKLIGIADHGADGQVEIVNNHAHPRILLPQNRCLP